MTIVHLDKKTIFSEFNLDDLSSEEKDQVFNLLSEIYNLRLLDAILDRLKEADQQKFLALIHDDEEKGRIFISERIKDLDNLLSETASQVKSDFAKDIKVARKNK